MFSHFTANGCDLELDGTVPGMTEQLVINAVVDDLRANKVSEGAHAPARARWLISTFAMGPGARPVQAKLAPATDASLAVGTGAGSTAAAARRRVRRKEVVLGQRVETGLPSPTSTGNVDGT